MSRVTVSLLILMLAVLALTRCAQIVAPTGGPKDTLPPVLLKASPPDSSLHFKAGRIELSFNEFIQLKDLQKEMIIAPNPKRQPQIQAKLRTLSIEWKDTLLPNTTYIINMGNAIEDNNEGNPLENFRYVFSTGDYLDSLEVGGKIVDARTGLPDSLMAVMLYNVSDTTGDSIVTKEKPTYYTRTKGDGSFLFQNLPHRTFRLFALKDGNGDLQYSDSTEAIAFIEKPLQVDSNILDVNLYAFLEKENKAAPSETSGTPADTSKKPKNLIYAVALSNGRQDLNKPLEITFPTPLKAIDSNKIVLEEDTTYRRVHFTFSLDTSRKEADLAYQWKGETPYRLILDSSFATDTSDVTLQKRDTVNFQTKGLSDYGTLALHFTTSDTTAQYVIQLFKGDNMLTSSPLKGNIWKAGFLDPGEYSARVLKDDNRNGHWDRGCYFCEEKRQPERVFSLPNKFTVKANWDNDFTDLKFRFEK